MSAESSFGRRVQRRRQLLDISAEGLAAQASISVHMLRKIERDERRPSREVAALLADALKIAPAEREQFLRAARQQADTDLHPKNGAKHSGCHLVEFRYKEAPMKKSTFTDEQIIAVLKRADAGEGVAELCRQAGISDSTFYRWKAKYDGLEVNELKRLKQLEDENRRLKQIVADLTLDNTALKDVLAKKW